MVSKLLTLGPVLSFRGIAGNKWRVTAIIGIGRKTSPPDFHLEGKKCPAPVVLHAHGESVVLRYDLTCALKKAERKVEFGIRSEKMAWSFTVPGAGNAPRMAYVSCNGFSDPSAMRRLIRPQNAVWSDLLSNHDKTLRPEGYVLDKEQLWHEERIHDNDLQRFHLLLMGGDQIYFDSIWEDMKPLKEWVSLSREEQLGFDVSDELEREIEDYYFSLYSKRWLPDRRNPWGSPELNHDGADAMARIPTIMMWDDHDIFDGWGSYSGEMQQSPLFKTLFKCARQAFWVYQMQHKFSDLPGLMEDERTSLSQVDPHFKPQPWRRLLARDALALPVLDGQPGFTSAFSIGPVSLVVADLRTERSRTQVMGAKTWSSLHHFLNTLPGEKSDHPDEKCQHLIFMSSVPVAHPKLSLAEGVLDNFGQDHVLDSSADDLRDHWSHDDHEGERKRLLETLTSVAENKKLRVSIVSGDVHVAAWGCAYRTDIPPTCNWAQIQQFTSSAVIHPSLVGMIERLYLWHLNSVASKVQTIDIQHNVQMMLFPGHNKYVMPSRNWLALELDPGNGKDGHKLWITWRCETESSYSNHLQAVQPAR
jgi:hypothetical protein